MGKQQQWGRLNNLEIVGLPEKSNESLPDIIRKNALHAGVALTSEQIEFIHRVQPRQHISGRPKPLVVKLSNRDLKDHILSGLRRKRGIQTSDIGISGSSQKFFVNEHLTPVNKNIFNEAKKLALEKGYKFIWIRNCNIFLRRSEQQPVISINSMKDLAKIV
ncbi:uncharacterized protein LOC126978977 [Leptidea sinapis]|uniref:uncharacterized protein LOC126978976 n=1 Tax=Leptidea sinapis TaxID=189913 RepID=UPI0021C3E891|nr:uncharacterized protein LOC126978976 [Leptidea sinapis]XP_050684070.1 uncharacterized protein LOC126978977 [Leptidea sinapis]